MSGSRMDITKEAMKLFIQSLPLDSKFQIISFGTGYENLRIDGSTHPFYQYNIENSQKALELIN